MNRYGQNRKKYLWWTVAIVLNLGAVVAIGQLIPEGKPYSALASVAGGFALAAVDLAILTRICLRKWK